MPSVRQAASVSQRKKDVGGKATTHLTPSETMANLLMRRRCANEVMTRGKLRGTPLSRIDLRAADFRSIALEFADLGQSDLDGGNFDGSELNYARVSGSKLVGTIPDWIIRTVMGEVLVVKV